MLQKFKQGKVKSEYDLSNFDRNTQVNKVLEFYKIVIENYSKFNLV